MRNLLTFIAKHSYWILFVLLEGISFWLLFSFNDYQGSVFATSANEVAGSFYEAKSELTSFIDLKKVNSQLAEENVSLRLRLIEMEARLDSAGIAHDSLAFMPPRYHTVSAKVIKSTLHRSNNYLTIDKGSADGVRAEMGVVCSAGIVGIVYLTSRHYAIVLPIISSKTNISCMVMNTNYFGTLQWKRGATNIAYLNDVPRHANVRTGEIIETNGYSAVFPRGIPVGRVLETGDSPDGLAYSLKVMLFTDFATLRDVSVITNYDRAERIMLEQKADSLETGKGL